MWSTDHLTKSPCIIARVHTPRSYVLLMTVRPLPATSTNENVNTGSYPCLESNLWEGRDYNLLESPPPHSHTARWHEFTTSLDISTSDHLQNGAGRRPCGGGAGDSKRISTRSDQKNHVNRHLKNSVGQLKKGHFVLNTTLRVTKEILKVTLYWGIPKYKKSINRAFLHKYCNLNLWEGENDEF